MSVPSATKPLLSLLLSLYIWGFIAYNLLPFSYYEVYIPEETLAPRPYVQRVHYLFGVRLNSLPDEDVISFVKREGIDLVLGFFPFEELGVFRSVIEAPECYLLLISHVSLKEKLLNFVFGYAPRLFLPSEPETFHTLLEPPAGECSLLVHDTDLKNPLRGFLIDSSRNMAYKRFQAPLRLERNVLMSKRRRVDIYAFSDKSFYYPGETTRYPFKIYARSRSKNSLLLLFKDGQLYRVYEGESAVMSINEKGSYTVRILTYRFSWNNYYFGIRLIAQSAPITYMY
ncbi:MAG: hypothetical protein GXO04_06510 [Aquificae bacterium]|nr:hypothetical protein [Aquificota bacterium]